MPPHLRTIKDLHEYLSLKEQKGQIPCKLVKEDTLRRYKRIFEWDKRIFEDMPIDANKRQIENTEYMHQELWNDYKSFHIIQRHKAKYLQKWKQKDLSESEKKELMTIEQSYNQAMDRLTSAPIRLGDMYAMNEVFIENSPSTDDDDGIPVVELTQQKDDETDQE